jgi:hypothetical protein
MFRITQDPSSGSTDLCLIKTTFNGSSLSVCAFGVWRHIQDLWCVCALRPIESYLLSTSRYSLCDPKHVGVILMCVSFSNFI